MLHKAFKIGEDALHSGSSAQAVVIRWCVGGSHQCQQMDIHEVVLLPMPGRGQNVSEEGGDQAARTPRH